MRRNYPVLPAAVLFSSGNRSRHLSRVREHNLHTSGLMKGPVSRQSGFSLTEMLVASTILAGALTALAELFGTSIRMTAAARSGGETMTLAVQKMEQLQSLAWGYDGSGLAISDFTSDTTVSPERSGGGTGLSASGSMALWQSTEGYIDYLDSSGSLLGGRTSPPQGAAYVRRWSIEPMPIDAKNALVLQVRVTRLNRPAIGQVMGRLSGDTRLVTVKTRTSR